MKPDGGIIRVVSIMEAQFVTGPAKPLLDFAQRARIAPAGFPAVEQSVVTYHRSTETRPSDNPFVAAAEGAGIPVDIVYEKGRFDHSAIPQIAAIFERLKPDIVETHNVKSHFLMRYSGLWRKYRWIAFFHGYVSTDLKMRMYNQLDRWSLRRAAHVVTVCGPFQRILEARGVDPALISIRHNSIQPFAPVDAREADALRQSLPCAPGTPLLLMVSRLSFEKGHVDFLEALAKLKQRGVRCHAVIVGEGHERKPIELAMERLDLKGDVTLAGQQNDVRAYYAAANLYLMPSHSEGSPLALLEAMIAGVPVIASRAGGIPEIIAGGSSGVLVPPRNPEALATAIEGLLADPAKARDLATNALRETARFTPEAYHRALLNVYERVLEVRG